MVLLPLPSHRPRRSRHSHVSVCQDSLRSARRRLPMSPCPYVAASGSQGPAARPLMGPFGSALPNEGSQRIACCGGPRGIPSLLDALAAGPRFAAASQTRWSVVPRREDSEHNRHVQLSRGQEGRTTFAEMIRGFVAFKALAWENNNNKNNKKRPDRTGEGNSAKQGHKYRKLDGGARFLQSTGSQPAPPLQSIQIGGKLPASSKVSY